MKQKEFLTKIDLIKKIKEKKELSGLANSIVSDVLNKYLDKYKIQLNSLSIKEVKIIIKEVRAELRNLTGQFQKSYKDRSKLLTEALLKTHTSTAERLPFYPKLKEIIKDTKAKSILDLGCGLNPIALANSKIKYYASDIKEDELSLIKSFFEKHKIPGKTFVYDLRKIKNDLPKADLCLLFKVLDIIDNKKHELSKEILKNVPCKKILVSFSTKKLSGKRMNFPERKWFEKLLKRPNYRYEKFNSENEVFYLVEKSA